MALASCGFSQDASVAESGVKRFHELLDAGQLQEIYSSSANELKTASSEKDFVALLDAVHRKLGATKSSEKVNWNFNVGTSGSFVTLAFKTVYAEGDASESFTFRMAGKDALLAGYRISSNALILK